MYNFADTALHFLSELVLLLLVMCLWLYSQNPKLSSEIFVWLIGHVIFYVWLIGHVILFVSLIGHVILMQIWLRKISWCRWYSEDNNGWQTPWWSRRDGSFNGKAISFNWWCLQICWQCCGKVAWNFLFMHSYFLFHIIIIFLLRKGVLLQITA